MQARGAVPARTFCDLAPRIHHLEQECKSFFPIPSNPVGRIPPDAVVFVCTGYGAWGVSAYHHPGPCANGRTSHEVPMARTAKGRAYRQWPGNDSRRNGGSTVLGSRAGPGKGAFPIRGNNTHRWCQSRRTCLPQSGKPRIICLFSGFLWSPCSVCCHLGERECPVHRSPGGLVCPPVQCRGGSGRSVWGIEPAFSGREGTQARRRCRNSRCRGTERPIDRSVTRRASQKGRTMRLNFISGPPWSLENGAGARDTPEDSGFLWSQGSGPSWPPTWVAMVPD